jgi:hypothetical protein
VEGIDRPSAWERLGPFGRFLVGFIAFAFISFVAVGAFEHLLALTVRVPTVDQLPDRVAVCGRTYRRAASGSEGLLTIGGIRDADSEPAIVLPLRMQPCVDAVRNGGTVEVFVRVVGDRYAAYELLGGP